MDYILEVDTRYRNSNEYTIRRCVFKTYDEACKKMVEELEKLNRQIMATDITDVAGYTIELREWVTGNKYKQVAKINYDLAL